VGQQVSIRVGRTLLARVVERAGTPVSASRAGLTHLFPTPAALIAADLSGLGLTSSRIATLKQLSQVTIESKLEFGASAEEVIRVLTHISGIGPSSAQYVALRGLGEPDAFPSADLVLRRTASERDGLTRESALERSAEAWRPWRAYAAVHLWCAASKAPCREPGA
jgi:AraC family transcriptional regulator, regulatory protein of adaptative response / DNA-3-methyladenine glycosylase II